MNNSLFFCAKSISMSTRDGRKPQTLLVAARHNLREHHAEYGACENISLELTPFNEVLHGPSHAKEVVDLANALKAKYSVPKRKLRKDHVQALEFVISARSCTEMDEMVYFQASMRWLINVFGSEMLLSAVVHRDESSPHMHALVLPIVEDQYQGGAPINKVSLRKLIKRFADEVGKPFGLSFVPRQKLNTAQRTAASNLVIDHLKAQSDPVVSSRIWHGVEGCIKFKPQEFLEILGLEVPIVRNKSFKTSTQIFTGTGKKTSEDHDRRVTHHLSCVGQQNFSASVDHGTRV